MEHFNICVRAASQSTARGAQLPTVIHSENILVCDVDKTLILHRLELTEEEREALDIVQFTDPYDGSIVTRFVHAAHRKLLVNHKARGALVIVWSQNGYQWAEAVVKALGLEAYVDFIMSKPRMHCDDLPSSEWMGERIYLKPDHVFGKGE